MKKTKETNFLTLMGFQDFSAGCFALPAFVPVSGGYSAESFASPGALFRVLAVIQRVPSLRRGFVLRPGCSLTSSFASLLMTKLC